MLVVEPLTKQYSVYQLRNRQQAQDWDSCCCCCCCEREHSISIRAGTPGTPGNTLAGCLAAWPAPLSVSLPAEADAVKFNTQKRTELNRISTVCLSVWLSDRRAMCGDFDFQLHGIERSRSCLHTAIDHPPAAIPDVPCSALLCPALRILSGSLQTHRQDHPHVRAIT